MPLWLKILVQIVPVGMVVIGLFAANDAWDFQNRSLDTKAEIVSIRTELKTRDKEVGSSETVATYYPTLRFVSEAKREYIVESSQPASGFVPKVGQVIPVRYYIDNPNWVRPYFSWWTLWAGPVIFVGIGLFVFIGLTLIFRIIARADAKRAKVRTVKRQ